MPKGVYTRTEFHRQVASDNWKKKLATDWVSPNLGRKMSEQSRVKNSLAHIGRIPWNKGKRETRICQFCKVNPIKLRSLKIKFCSIKCSSANRKGKKQPWVVLHVGGEKCHLWKGGITPKKKMERSSKDWMWWRKAVYERDNYTCQVCMNRGVALEPHHIIPRRISSELTFDVSNGITLCKPCHQKTKSREELYAQSFTEILQAAI